MTSKSLGVVDMAFCRGTICHAVTPASDNAAPIKLDLALAL